MTPVGYPPLDEDQRLVRAPFDGLSDDERLRKVRVTFYRLLLGEIERMLNPATPPAGAPIGVGAMILACCAIDFLSTLYAGEDSRQEHFESFTTTYLKHFGYDPTKLRFLRNGLVHNYAVRNEAYAFDAGQQHRPKHLTHDAESGRDWIIVDCLLDDIRGAADLLFEQALQPGLVRCNMLRRTYTPGLLRMR
jgi:hypothetical protein